VSPFSTPFAFASPVTLGLSTLFSNPLQCSLNAISNAIDMTAVLLWPWVSVDFRFCLIMKMVGGLALLVFNEYPATWPKSRQGLLSYPN